MKLVQTRNFQQTSLPVDTGRKLNAHKTFRRRTGRLLNVLCTFNSRPVSTTLSEDLSGNKKPATNSLHC